MFKSVLDDKTLVFLIYMYLDFLPHKTSHNSSGKIVVFQTFLITRSLVLFSAQSINMRVDISWLDL